MLCLKTRNKILPILICIGILFSSLVKANSIQDESDGITQQSQQNRVIGVIRDSTGEPLIGVSIMVKGTTSGTITDVDGNYILTAPANGTLIFTYVGYKSVELKVEGRTNIDVVLEEDAMMMDEVVAVGYGSQRKISTVGAQAGVKFVEDLKQPVATLNSVLAGRIAGVIGMQRSGEAGKDDNTQIWIRGVSTTTNTTPLVLVDGVERSYSNLDPEDIASFQVLKDASATAVYGVRGANGVILIETKKGFKGKPRIRVEYNAGITSFTKVPELADGVTYMQMANEAAVNKGEAPIYSQEVIRKTYTQEDPLLYPNVNWLKEIFKDHGYNQRANINASGGSEFAQYYVSLGYYNESGLYDKRPEEKYDGSMNFNRINFVNNLTMQVTKTTEVDFGVKGEISDYNTPYYSAEDVFGMMMKAYPTLYPVTYEDGKIPYANNGGGVKNPYAMVYRMGSNKRNTSETRADLNVRQKLDFILPGLSARALVAYDFYMRNDVQRKGEDPITYYASGRDNEGNLILNRTDDNKGKDSWGYNKQQWGHRQYYLEAALNYEQIFANTHRVSGLFLYNMTDYSNVTAGELIHSLPFRNLGIAGRGTYSYNDRYFVEANFGYNGAENFSPGNRFGFFPSFGLAWVPSNEKFFEPIADKINFLKFRFSWGQAGNSVLDDKPRGESNERFVYLPTVNTGKEGYSFGAQRQVSYNGTAVGKPSIDVTWETSTKMNVGADLNFWNNDLTFQVDFFKEDRKNIFLQRASIPAYLGVVVIPYGNYGRVENKGFEITGDLSKQWGPVAFMFRGNFSFNKNKIIEDDTSVKPYPWLNTRGTSLKTKFGYICDGFYTQEDIDNPEIAKLKDVTVRPGDLKYRDLNGDGVIDASDKTIIGNPEVPQIVYGLGTTISYKNFTLGAFFQGVAKTDLSLSASSFKPFSDSSAKGNLYANIVDRWTPENPSQDAKWPRLDYGLTTNAENYAESTFWLRSGAYLRLKTLDLAYDIPSHITKKWNINNFRIYLQAYNLLTFTGFDMWDVELGAGDGTKYPNTKSFNIGVSFSF